jgi:hypothetical protein
MTCAWTRLIAIAWKGASYREAAVSLRRLRAHAAARADASDHAELWAHAGSGSYRSSMDVMREPDADLTELIQRLSGRWRVSGLAIGGLAEYRSANGGFLLVGDVDFVVNGNKIKNIQQVAFDQDTGTLRGRYMDTAGDASIYTWALDGSRFRVTLDGADSDTYFDAAFSADNSEYTGTWHYPPGVDGGSDDERIVYTRIAE